MPDHGTAPRAADSAPGVREVILLAAAVVGAVLGAAIVTSFLPAGLQGVIFHTPLAIAVLIVGTAGVLWRLTRRPQG